MNQKDGKNIKPTLVRCIEHDCSNLPDESLFSLKDLLENLCAYSEEIMDSQIGDVEYPPNDSALAFREEQENIDLYAVIDLLEAMEQPHLTSVLRNFDRPILEESHPRYRWYSLNAVKIQIAPFHEKFDVCSDILKTFANRFKGLDESTYTKEYYAQYQAGLLALIELFKALGLSEVATELEPSLVNKDESSVQRPSTLCSLLIPRSIQRLKTLLPECKDADVRFEDSAISTTDYNRETTEKTHELVNAPPTNKIGGPAEASESTDRDPSLNEKNVDAREVVYLNNSYTKGKLHGEVYKLGKANFMMKLTSKLMELNKENPDDDSCWLHQDEFENLHPPARTSLKGAIRSLTPEAKTFFTEIIEEEPEIDGGAVVQKFRLKTKYRYQIDQF